MWFSRPVDAQTVQTNANDNPLIAGWVNAYENVEAIRIPTNCYESKMTLFEFESY